MNTKLVIPGKEIARWNKLLEQDEVDFEKEGIEEDKVVARWTLVFDDDHWADLEVVSTQDSTLWCQMVWFDHGTEFACSDVCYELDGIWPCSGYENYDIEVAADK